MNNNNNENNSSSFILRLIQRIANKEQTEYKTL